MTNAEKRAGECFDGLARLRWAMKDAIPAAALVRPMDYERLSSPC
jgi:hypothetical protein